MSTFYIYSILAYYLFLILAVIRTIITFDLINKCKASETKSKSANKLNLIYAYIRILVTSLIPFINTLLALSFLYFVICDDETFKKSAGKRYTNKQ